MGNASTGFDAAEIEELDRTALAKRWEGCSGSPPPKRAARKLLAIALAYKVQLANDPSAQKAEKVISRKIASKGAVLKHQQLEGRKLSPGTRLMREWQGRTLIVDVTHDGFHFDGSSFRSLSAIARQVTGSARNGPAFFGLRRQKRP